MTSLHFYLVSGAVSSFLFTIFYSICGIYLNVTLFFSKGIITIYFTHLRFRFLLKHKISYAYVYVAVVYIVYTCESGEKQGEMLTTWINPIIQNLTVAHLYIHFLPIWNQTSTRIYYLSQLILTQTNQDAKLSKFFFKILFSVVLPYEWFVFQVYQTKLCRYLLSGETLYHKKCEVAGKIKRKILMQQL
jgi:hypothetical protein